MNEITCVLKKVVTCAKKSKDSDFFATLKEDHISRNFFNEHDANTLHNLLKIKGKKKVVLVEHRLIMKNRDKDEHAT